MTIITSSFTKRQLQMKFFKHLLSKSLKRDYFDTLITAIAESLKVNSIVSPYKSCAALLKAYELNPNDTKYNEAFTALKKLGIIFKHGNKYLLNPLVEDKASSRRYELAIEYYSLLFQDLAFDFMTVDQLREQAVHLYMADLQQLNQRIEDANYIYEDKDKGEYTTLLSLKSSSEYYDIAFCSLKPNSLYGSTKAIYNAVNETYRNISGNYVTDLLIKHIFMLEQQGLVTVEWGGRGSKTKYNFNRLTYKLQKSLISYTDTKYYQDNLPTPDEELVEQLFSDINPPLQQQFEEEDFSEQQTMSTTTPSTEPFSHLPEDQRPRSYINRPSGAGVTELQVSLYLLGISAKPDGVYKRFCTLNPKTAQQLKDDGLLDPEALAELEYDLAVHSVNRVATVCSKRSEATYGYKSKEELQLFPNHYCTSTSEVSSTEERKAEIARQDAIDFATAQQYNNEVRACNERNRIKHSQLFQDYLVAREEWGFASLTEYKEAIGYQPEKVPIPSSLL